MSTKSLFLLFFLCAANLFSRAQSDTIFPNIYGTWYVKTINYDIGDPNYGNYSCEFYADSVDTLGYLWSTVIDLSGNPVGLVTADSGKVLYLSTDWFMGGFVSIAPVDSIIVLYDFNLQVGDTAYYDEGFPVTVDYLSTTPVLGVTKNTLELSNGDVWIYGLGSIEGFFRPILSSFEMNYWLCDFQGGYEDSLGNSYTLYYHSNSACAVSIEEGNANTIITLTNTSAKINLVKHEWVRIYSITGSLEYCEYIAAGTSTLDLSGLSAGVYILNLGADCSQKFVRL